MPFRHFQFGLGGFYTFNLVSSNLAKPGSITGSPNRYEIGLFQIQNPSQTNNLYKLEYFCLKYQLKNVQATLQKQLLQTPFINPQDGSMRPTFEDGLYIKCVHPKTTREGGWPYNILPRSTIQWFSVPDSIGWYAQGLNLSGSAGNYRDNLSGSGIGLFGITHQVNKTVSIKLWKQFVENIFNTSLIELNYMPSIHQQNQDKTYMMKGNTAYIFSGRVGLKNQLMETTLNYTRIADNDRFLNPCEWGIEPFYTFMYRERNEGNGNLNAVNVECKMENPFKKIVIGRTTRLLCTA